MNVKACNREANDSTRMSYERLPRRGSTKTEIRRMNWSLSCGKGHSKPRRQYCKSIKIHSIFRYW